MQRTLQPELLDSLAPNDPAAARNRRDLALTNRIMGNHRWFARTLPPLLPAKARVLELGAGTGELGRRLARKGIAVDGLDLWPRPDDWPANQEWHRADLRDFKSYSPYFAVIANLILHQFSDPELAQIGAELRRHARIIVACEPMRRRISQTLFRAVAPLLGAHPVTLHDAHVSIAAGFIDDELPRVLGLNSSEWDCTCSTTHRGAYHLVARRRSP